MMLFGNQLSLPIVLGLALAILTTIAGSYGLVWVNGFNTAKNSSAIVFQRSLDAANREADNRVQQALDAAEEVAPTPATDAELAKLCAGDTACRDRKG